jgi:REP element-mobilizing transposase RayT
MLTHTDPPSGYLITFRTYGTWLHGDPRGSIDRFHNQYGTPFIPANDRWQRHNRRLLKGEPVLLTPQQRESTEAAIIETCKIRNWILRALNVRTNHVHVVLSIGGWPPERALNALKSNATRQMRQDGCWPETHSPWAAKGSHRYLWNPPSVERAIVYVLEGQGRALS